MSAPAVACVMLTNGRPEMVARAERCFESQTYQKLYMIRYDNHGQKSIGALRNEANAGGAIKPDIICHWDSDDWSHPNRIAEQVALLQSSGAECVGYHEMLFWESAWVGRNFNDGLAWLYRASIPNYAIGTSMCYWRETWERHPFPDRSEGCDDLYWFNKGVKIASVEALTLQPDGTGIFRDEPLMIASIHGGNTCSKIAAGAREWTRVPEWDGHCREAMRL